jgi:peptidoglycan/LPS O-acetylase OafA/YrhL
LRRDERRKRQAAKVAGRQAEQRFVTMDGVRGVAAICVMLFHISAGAGADAFPLAKFAVDVFFGLSGFVLAESYDRRLAEGLTPLRFMGLRAARLYPIYALGMALGVAYALVGLALGAPPTSPARFLGALVNGLAFLPAQGQLRFGFNLHPTIVVFPFNVVAWSLCAELTVNAFFAMSRPRGALRAAPVLLAPAVAAAMIFLAGYSARQLDSTLLGGMLRAFYGFFLGVAIREARAAVTPRLPAWIAPLAVAVLCLGAPDSMPLFLALIALAAPLIVLASTVEPEAAWLRAAFSYLGKASFPLYALHEPAFGLVKTAYNSLAGAPYADRPPLYVVALFAAALVPACAWLADRVETPLRATLTRLVLAREGAAAPASTAA